MENKPKKSFPDIKTSFGGIQLLRSHKMKLWERNNWMPPKDVLKLFSKVHDYVLLGSYPEIPCWKCYSRKISRYVTMRFLSLHQNGE